MLNKIKNTLAMLYLKCLSMLYGMVIRLSVKIGDRDQALDLIGRRFKMWEEKGFNKVKDPRVKKVDSWFWKHEKKAMQQIFKDLGEDVENYLKQLNV